MKKYLNWCTITFQSLIRILDKPTIRSLMPVGPKYLKIRVFPILYLKLD